MVEKIQVETVVFLPILCLVFPYQLGDLYYVACLHSVSGKQWMESGESFRELLQKNERKHLMFYFLCVPCTVFLFLINRKNSSCGPLMVVKNADTPWYFICVGNIFPGRSAFLGLGGGVVVTG